MIIDSGGPFSTRASDIHQAAHRIGLRLAGLCLLLASTVFIAAFLLSVHEWYAVKNRLEADVQGFEHAASNSVPWEKSKVSRFAKPTETSLDIRPDLMLQRHLQTSAVTGAIPTFWVFLNGVCAALLIYCFARACGWAAARMIP